MPFAYVVRCNFTRPDLEDAFNDWYSGPKLADMLEKPMFLSGQRFVADAGHTARRYLALWTVEGPEAFQTPQYTSDWGFFEWKPSITDWSRDLYPLPAAVSPADFAVAEDARLHLLSFDGVPEADADALLAEVAPLRPQMVFLSVAGIDRHSPRLGLARLAPDAPLPPPLALAGVQETAFRPISRFATPAA